MKTATDIIDRLGGTFAVARICKIRPPSVSKWKERNRIPPARRQFLELYKPAAFVEDEPETSSAANDCVPGNGREG
jgi:hypothetical protein